MSRRRSAAPRRDRRTTRSSVMPFCVGVREHLVVLRERVGSTQLSFSPKLIEMTSPRLWSTAYFERAQDVGVVIRLGEHQDDVRAGRDGVGPQDVEADLLGPTGHVGVAGDERRQAVRRDLGERAEVRVRRAAEPVQARQPVKAVEDIQLLHDVRGLERVDDDDRLSPAVVARVDESVGVVGVPHLIRVVAGGTWAQADHLACEESIARGSRIGGACLRTHLDKGRCGRGIGRAASRCHEAENQGDWGETDRTL